MKIISVDAPVWFFQSEIVIQIIFAVVTLLIALYAYKVYRLSRQRNSFLFGMGFLSISISYFIEAFFNLMLLEQVHTCDVIGFLMGQPVHSNLALSVFVVFMHMFTMVAGVSLLAYVTLKERMMRTYALLLTLSLFGLIMARSLSVMFYTLIGIFFAFITLQYYLKFSKRPTKDSLIVFLGFGSVFLGIIQLALSTKLSALYISGHIVSLVGYLLLLVNLMRVVRK